MAEKEKSLLQPHAERDPALTGETIQRQMERILASPEFHATDRQREFLQFVVTETIAGRDQGIKGYTVATRVFGRKEDFDQATDPIVSIQANQLRRALERYYLVAGKQDPVRIDIPKGTYVPTFLEQTGVESDRISSSDEGAEIRFEGSWPGLMVRPFQNLTGDPELDYVAVGLAIELAMEITRYQDIRVMMYDPGGHGRRASDLGARFTIDGSVRKDAAGMRVDVQLIDTRTNMQIWGDAHPYGLRPGRLIAFQEHVARVVAAKIAGEFGIIGKTLSAESKNIPPSDLRTYEAMLRYYEFNFSFSAENFYSAFEALKFASSKEPECGLIWSMLARLYAINYSLELFDVETSLEEAVSFAERGARLDPANQRVRLILAYVLLFKNEITAGLAETDRALALNPNSLMFLENIGYLMTLFGDWRRGPALIRKAIKFNPYYNLTVHYALWVDWVRQEDYEQAYLETLNFRTPLLFWDPLMKAASFGLLGRYGEGKGAVENLLKLKPDFTTRGRILIGRYIKFEDVLERVIEGLSKSGLSMADD
jgi:TolB-like protein